MLIILHDLMQAFKRFLSLVVVLARMNGLPFKTVHDMSFFIFPVEALQCRRY